MLITAVLIAQLFVSVIMALYFSSIMKKQKSNKAYISKDSEFELNKIKKKELIKLNRPLTETARPDSLEEIVGQTEGITNLKAVMCGENPQHVLIYGPPGVGKTAAARAVLECAKKSETSPFAPGAKFVEVDATTVQYDERSIADPLIGSVHDPIYQGAGAYGPAGVPQPKPGAVTKAHGGILFIDEIGELPPVQLNRLLKVLEDRRVHFESSYYASDDPNIPKHIHYAFKKGLPADFRLIGATTRSPEEINPAIRSRCVEIFFRSLTKDELVTIGRKAAEKAFLKVDDAQLKYAADFAQNGRDMVNIVQMAASIAKSGGRYVIEQNDIQWVADSCRYSRMIRNKLTAKTRIGKVHGLGVSGAGGSVIDIEASAEPGNGRFKVSGIVESEEFEARGQRMAKRSSAVEATDNIVTVLKNYCDIDCSKYDIHINIPNSAPVDGPSAGTAMLCAVYSAVTGCTVSGDTVLTGEISILGEVRPVGGIKQKLEAAYDAGAKRAVIPFDNMEDARLSKIDSVEGVKSIRELFDLVFDDRGRVGKSDLNAGSQNDLIAAERVIN